MLAKIPSVTAVNYSISKSNPPIYTICAAGIVPTSGWGGGQLLPAVYVTPPADGIQDFEFVALAPTGDVLQVESPIAASWTGGLPNWANGVRVNAAHNDIEVVFGASTACASLDLQQAGGEVPWPWAAA